MNTPSIGPNLNLNPNADFSDGEIEAVMIHESNRDQLAEYIKRRKKKGPDEKFFFNACVERRLPCSGRGPCFT